MPKPPLSLYAIVPPGLEVQAAAELRALGPRATEGHGGLQWEGDWDGLAAVHLQSRIVGRVLVRVARFRARALGELERKIARVDWDPWIPRERRDPARPPPPLSVSCSRSRLYHEGAVAERVLRGLGWEPGDPGPPEVQEGHGVDAIPPDPFTLHVRVHRDTVTLSLDATGAPLHRRGYRRRGGVAPLRATLAAAALRASGWTPGFPLLDPFAGSGTIVIEAALIARGIPPALSDRSRRPPAFPFLEWEGFPRDLWEDRVARAREGIRAGAPAPIVASDRDPEALERLRVNAEAAGVLDDLAIARASLTEAPDPPAREHGSPLPEPVSHPAGWIVSNPPHGGRLGDRRTLRPLYRALGSRLAGRWEGWDASLFVRDPTLLAVLQRELDRRGGRTLEPLFTVRHGGTPITLVRRAPPPPPAPRPDP